jgi:hypothetical protein
MRSHRVNRTAKMTIEREKFGIELGWDLWAHLEKFLLAPDIFPFKAMFSLSPDTCENQIVQFFFSEWSVQLQLNAEYSPEKHHDSQVPWTFDILVLGIYQRDFFVLMELTRIWGGEARSTIKQANEMGFAEKQLEKSRCHGCPEPERTT